MPVLVGTEICTASGTALALQLGCDVVLLDGANAHARDLVRMAVAIRNAVTARRAAFLAGRTSRGYKADASSPMKGPIQWG